jgi:hypothetical protein
MLITSKKINTAMPTLKLFTPYCNIVTYVIRSQEMDIEIMYASHFQIFGELTRKKIHIKESC